MTTTAAKSLAVVALIGFAILCGFIGLDFGYHWDEEQTLRSVVTTIETGVFLPSLYLYPGMNFIVPLCALLPTAARAVLTGTPPPLPPGPPVVLPDYLAVGKPRTNTTLDRLQSGLKLFAWSKPYWLRVRAVYLVISLLVVLWTFAIIMVWRKRFYEALLGAALMALSWEFGYHSRWITPDQMMTSFIILSLLFVFIARTRERAGPWFTLAAIAAGVACGTKYPGVIALLPIAVAVLQDARAKTPRRLPWKEGLHLGVVCFAAYLVTTPGTLLDPLRFSHDLGYQFRVYWNGWEDHTISRGPEHLMKILGYYALSAFSHRIPIAVAAFALTIVGAVLVVRENRWDAIILVGIPLLYTLYMSSQRVMFVRNYLLVLPFLAILAARGAAFLTSLLRQRRVLRYVIPSLLCIMLAVNAAWLWTAAQTISVRTYARYRYPIELLDYLNKNRTKSFALSPKVRREIVGLTGGLPANVTQTLDSAQYAVLYAREVTDPSRWDATHFNYTVTWFGTYEVNFNYYPSWKGDDRIIVLRGRDAVRLGLFDVVGSVTGCQKTRTASGPTAAGGERS